MCWLHYTMFIYQDFLELSENYGQWTSPDAEFEELTKTEELTDFLDDNSSELEKFELEIYSVDRGIDPGKATVKVQLTFKQVNFVEKDSKTINKLKDYKMKINVLLNLIEEEWKIIGISPARN